MSLNLRVKIGWWLSIILLVGLYPASAYSSPELIQARMQDGVLLKVHLEQDWPEEKLAYARQILKAARIAYEEIVWGQGFSRFGYTFAQASKEFTYDIDRAIDIYIDNNTEAPYAFCQLRDEKEYKAKIFIPGDYQKYRKTYNITQPFLELKATLVHELLHIITYSYNRNMQANPQGKFSLTSRHWDWYTEGLARYFETLVGYREEFLSAGFKKQCGRKNIIYKGGVNYFLRYPDAPLHKRKYDFALFWQYLHQHYGMDRIEEISFKFRQLEPQLCSNSEAMQVIAQTLDIPLKNLLHNFSLYVYKASSLAAEETNELKAVSLSKLSSSRNRIFSIYSFGFDFYELDLKEGFQFVRVQNLNAKQGLNCLIGVHSPFGFCSVPVEPDASGRIRIDTAGLTQYGKLIIMLSNSTDQIISYRISYN